MVSLGKKARHRRHAAFLVNVYVFANLIYCREWRFPLVFIRGYCLPSMRSRATWLCNAHVYIAFNTTTWILTATEESLAQPGDMNRINTAMGFKPLNLQDLLTRVGGFWINLRPPIFFVLYVCFNALFPTKKKLKNIHSMEYEDRRRLIMILVYFVQHWQVNACLQIVRAGSGDYESWWVWPSNNKILLAFVKSCSSKLHLLQYHYILERCISSWYDS